MLWESIGKNNSKGIIGHSFKKLNLDGDRKGHRQHNPIHAYSEESLIAFNGSYSQVSLHRIVYSLNS